MLIRLNFANVSGLAIRRYSTALGDPTRLEMHDMRFSAGQAALKFNKLGPVHFIDIRANIEIRKWGSGI
jgi:hypothetical protein